MLAIALTPDSHGYFDELWALEIAEDGTSCEATIKEIANAALQTYRGEPDILAVVNQWIDAMKLSGLL